MLGSVAKCSFLGRVAFKEGRKGVEGVFFPARGGGWKKEGGGCKFVNLSNPILHGNLLPGETELQELQHLHS